MTHPTTASDVLVQALYKVVPLVLDASGNGTVSVGPQSPNEYWAPTLIRVATNNKNSPVASCTVFHGPPGALDQTGYLDDTALGNQDASSIIAGTVVIYGQVITAVFAGGNPGDSASVIVTGIYTNVPPTIGQLPQVPGTHFAGKLQAEVDLVAALVPQASPVPLPFGVTLIGPFDVRKWASYYFKLFVNVPGTPTSFNPITLTMFWARTPQGTDLVFQDGIEWVADGTGGGFAFTGGPLTVQDSHHGPYLLIELQNNGGDVPNLNYTLTFTTRVLPAGMLVRQQNTYLGLLILNAGVQSIGVSATIVIPLGASYGRTLFKFFALSQSLTFEILQIRTGTILDAFTVAAGATFRTEYVLEKEALAIQIVNGAGGAASYAVTAITQFNRS